VRARDITVLGAGPAGLYFAALARKADPDLSIRVIERNPPDATYGWGVVFSDQNAASQYARFLQPNQAKYLDLKAIYARDWTHADPIRQYQRRSKKCAEVLVPHCVPVDFLIGAYVPSVIIQDQLRNLGFDLAISIDSDLFFQ
jgi:NADPH-dependent 2,4-dienoyl-CoA reductase/sulfur reductase-like enzyme